MTNSPTTCSHCGAKDSITEELEIFFCTNCGKWGYSQDKLEFAPDSFRDEDWRVGQVKKRPICE